MSYITVSADVYLDEIICGMNKRDKQELVDELYDDGYTPTPLQEKPINKNDAFSKACQKLIGQSWRLTKAEEEFIINISNRF